MPKTQQTPMLGWTQDMIGSLWDLTQPAITQRFQSEIRDCEKLIESKLKLKNPVDLIDDPEMPTPELLAWAISSGTRSMTCPILAPRTRKRVPSACVVLIRRNRASDRT